ncbi:MAG: methyltransferase domain-containing protein [Phycisphaerales bacterium]|nr:methyltransferase domain-containing protein [Phycisphaerales bacterium]
MTNWNPQDYHRHSSQQHHWANQILAHLALKGDETILDIGCGDGKITAQIAHAVSRERGGGRVVGIDNSAEMIAFAQQAFPADTFGNLWFQQADARSLPFVAEFDLVLSFTCLHWVLDHRPVLAGIQRALRSGGRTLLQFGGKGNAAEIVDAVTQVTRRPSWASYFVGFEFPWGFYSPEEYRAWLAEAGLRAVRVELVPKDMIHQGPAGLASWLRTTWMPYVQRVPADLQQAFLNESVAEYLKAHPADAQGNVHMNMVRLEVEATRE